MWLRLLIILSYLAVNPTLIAKSLTCSTQTINHLCSNNDLDQLNPSSALLANNALNPIDIFNGNKYLLEVDYYPHPQAPELEISRHYNSFGNYYAQLGGQWRLNYDTRLLQKNPPLLQQANGTVTALQTKQGKLIQQPRRTIWQDHKGNEWHFDAAGWLIQLQRSQQPPVRIQRHEKGILKHQIQRISQNQRQLQFHYNASALIERITTPIGDISYSYTNVPDSVLKRLETVDYPDLRRLNYHYEPDYQQQHRWAITGKSIQQHPTSTSYRVRSWIYDYQGRAIFMMGKQPQQWVRVHYPTDQHPLQTQLQSSSGLTTVRFSAQNQQIESVTGANCWSCPPNLSRTTNRLQFPNFTVQHDQQQRIQRIQGQFLGWPDLVLEYNDQGQLLRWQTALQQYTELYYEQQRPQKMQFANGDSQQVYYNAQQQLIGIDYQSANERLQTKLSRPSPLHLHLQHPTENEQLHVNAAGLILQRKVQRQLSTPTGTISWHYQERFEYDEQQRLIKHHLPEGGTLLYQWQNHQLQRIDWQNNNGLQQPIILRQHQSLLYGNGLVLEQQYQGQQRQLVLKHNSQLWWQQRLQQQQGLITQIKQQFPILNNTVSTESNYVYNSNQQLIIQQNKNQTPDFYAWDTSGALAAHNQNSSPVITRDSSGLAQQWKNQGNNYILGYNALRQLDVVLDSEKTVQKNRYNSYGFRIYTQHYPQANQQFFLYHQKRLVAEYNAPFSRKLPIHAAHPISRRYVYFENQPVALIDYDLSAQGELLVIHSDHLGAPHLVSDQQQVLRWAATYDAFGLATKVAGDLDLHLRREGQYYDISTKWHNNLLRTYLPQQGHYLETDPLGPNPVTQLLGYAKQQPLNHTDPWGLVLFAFDGTRYDETSGGVIHALHQATQEPSFYAAGPGNPHSTDWDAMTSYSTHQIVYQQWQNLVRYLDSNKNKSTPAIPIDIIGFSRGATIGRHFANLILNHTQHGLLSYTNNYGQKVSACIQPRFMGLLDGVAQMGALGTKNYLYDFSVSPAWQWVVHGVAMHEYRFLFPLYSLGEQSNSLEVGFVGAHGDLGGGYLTPNMPNVTNLSDVSLQWILWHARAQGMTFNDMPINTNAQFAYLHDESQPLAADRMIENQKPMDLQANHPRYGAQARHQVKAFLDFNLSDQERNNNQVAKVDLTAYYRWLDQTLQWSPE